LAHPGVEEVIVKNHSVILFIAMSILALTLVGCGPKSDPEDVYWQYWKACSNGDFIAAEKFLEEAARDKAKTLGACGFAHDAINTVELANGRPDRVFEDDPEVSVIDNSASLTWFDTQGNLANVILIEIEGEWKLTEATWSK